jgi:hypothetical protein
MTPTFGLTYLFTDGTEHAIPNVEERLIIKTQAKAKPQFAPVALPPKPGGQGGQNEYLFIEDADVRLCFALNLDAAIRQWLWGHEVAGWPYWVDKKDVTRIEKENQKRKRAERIPLWEAARVLCWPAVAMLGNVVYIDKYVGNWGHVVGIPTDAAVNAEMIHSHPGWIHLAVNTKGQIILRNGLPSYVPIFAREGRRGKASGSLWIDTGYLG